MHVGLRAHPVLTEDVLEAVRDVDEGIAEALKDKADSPRARAIARFAPDAKVEPGEVRELAIVPEKLRFFDPETGLAV